MILIATLTTSAVFALIVWAVLRYTDGRDTRYQDTLDRLVATLEREQQAHRDETQMLLQRIQAPQQAVIQHAQQTAGPPPDGYPLSEQESAMAQDERLRAQAVLDQIADMERDENLSVLGLVGE